MAFIQAAYHSPAIQKAVALNALVPDEGKGPFAVLYLLHGYSDDHTIWHRRTRIEEYVKGLPLVVIMPDGFHSFYTNAYDGLPYEDYLLNDMMGFVERTFPVSRKRAGRCIGGLSMGGYGAVRLALNHPKLFVSCHSHSGAMWNLADRKNPPPDRLKRMEKLFGPKFAGGVNDLYALARKAKKANARLPKLRIDCGVDDYLIEGNRNYHAYLDKLGIAHAYAEYPGMHNWVYWDTHIQEALQFHARHLKIRRRG